MTNDFRRQSFELDGYGHGGNPIPAAARVGNILASGGISGRDLTTGALGDGIAEQCRLMFELVRAILSAAGASLSDVLKISVYLRSDQPRDDLNHEWVQAFPDPHSRPVRHVVKYDGLPEGMLIQCEFLAVVTDGPTDDQDRT